MQTTQIEKQLEPSPRLLESGFVTSSLGSGQWTHADEIARRKAYAESKRPTMTGKTREAAEWILNNLPDEGTDSKEFTAKGVEAGHKRTTLGTAKTKLGITHLFSDFYNQTTNPYVYTYWCWVVPPDGVPGFPVLPKQRPRKVTFTRDGNKLSLTGRKKNRGPRKPASAHSVLIGDLERARTANSTLWTGRNASRNREGVDVLLTLAEEYGSLEFPTTHKEIIDEARWFSLSNEKVLGMLNDAQTAGLIEYTNGSPRQFVRGHMGPVAPGKYTWVRIIPPKKRTKRTPGSQLPNLQHELFAYDELGDMGYNLVAHCIANPDLDVRSPTKIAQSIGCHRSSAHRVRAKLIERGMIDDDGHLIDPLQYTKPGNDSKLKARQDRRLEYIKAIDRPSSNVPYPSGGVVRQDLVRASSSFDLSSKEEVGSADLEALRARIMAQARAQKLEDEKHEAPSLQDPEARALAELQSLIIGHRGLARLENSRDDACAEPLTPHTTLTPQSSVADTPRTGSAGNEEERDLSLSHLRSLITGHEVPTPQPETKLCTSCKRDRRERFYDQGQWTSEKPTCRPCVFQYEKQLAAMEAGRLEWERVRAEAKARQKKARPRVRRNA